MTNDKLFTSKEAAEYLGISRYSLNMWRSKKRYIIPYIRLGRWIRYRQSALDEFLKQRTQTGE